MSFPRTILTLDVFHRFPNLTRPILFFPFYLCDCPLLSLFLLGSDIRALTDEGRQVHVHTEVRYYISDHLSDVVFEADLGVCPRSDIKNRKKDSSYLVCAEILSSLPP